jgi:16S rRNA (cytidine1402-2'-O)-methyltransferase
MMVSQSPATSAAGRLYLVATPIGNLEDITLRALRVLHEVDLIACEDTRRTQKLLNHYEIKKPLVSYHEHNEMTRAPELVIELERGGQIALVSDAGMPLISDPGHRLVSLCIRHSIAVVPVPGASALVAALAASGLSTDEFLFVGFLPARSAARRRALERLLPEQRTLVFYEAPHRLADTLRDAAALLGDRPACIAREVSKVHEEFRRGTLSELAAHAAAGSMRGEITLLLGAPTPGETAAAAPTTQSLAERVDELIREAKVNRKEALKLAAKEHGLTRRAAYHQMLDARTRGAQPPDSDQKTR